MIGEDQRFIEIILFLLPVLRVKHGQKFTVPTQMYQASKTLLNGSPEIMSAGLLQIIIGFFLVLVFRTLIETLAYNVV
jgi:hypothetical protein